MKILFCLYDSPWPIRGGQQLHTYNMIKGLVALGHDVHLAAYGDISSFPPHKYQGWSVSRLSEPSDNFSVQNAHFLHRRFAERWMRYWGTPSWALSSLNKLTRDYRPDTVILVGLQALPLSAATGDFPTLWYAADDWVLHHLTLAKRGPLRDRVCSLRNALLSFCYERSLSAQLAGAIAVSQKDQRALRWAGGFRQVVLIPNGVDADFFSPCTVKHAEKTSLCFWGRMDFEPNIDAMVWFCRDIWPLLLSRFPDAELTIVGANPTSAVRELGANRNVIVTGEVEDVRPFALNSQVVIMPIRIGGGIKNKLLEACALGKSVIASPTAVAGLESKNGSSQPWILARSAEDWIKAIELLWTNPEIRMTLGRSARNFVLKNHSWSEAAGKLVGFIQETGEGRRL